MPKPDLPETANWWTDALLLHATPDQLKALWRAVRLTQERFDVDWSGQPKA